MQSGKHAILRSAVPSAQETDSPIGQGGENFQVLEGQPTFGSLTTVRIQTDFSSLQQATKAWVSFPHRGGAPESAMFLQTRGYHVTLGSFLLPYTLVPRAQPGTLTGTLELCSINQCHSSAIPASGSILPLFPFLSSFTGDGGLRHLLPQLFLSL